jgi:hypothetical protein
MFIVVRVSEARHSFRSAMFVWSYLLKLVPFSFEGVLLARNIALLKECLILFRPKSINISLLRSDGIGLRLNSMMRTQSRFILAD